MQGESLGQNATIEGQAGEETLRGGKPGEQVAKAKGRGRL